MNQIAEVGGVKRYNVEEIMDGYSGRVATAIPNGGGEFVKYDEHALAMDRQRRELLASHLIAQVVEEERNNKEIARLTSIISGVQLELEDELKKRLAIEARVAGLEKDAARYRWLRDVPWIGDDFGYELRMAIQFQRNELWDDLIDEAMGREA